MMKVEKIKFIHPFSIPASSEVHKLRGHGCDPDNKVQILRVK